MKKLILFISTLLCFQAFSNSINDLLIPNPYEASFRKAYLLNPSIPKGVLESVAFSQSRFTDLNVSVEPSCIGYPTAFGVMGLTENGQGYFRNNLISDNLIHLDVSNNSLTFFDGNFKNILFELLNRLYLFIDMSFNTYYFYCFKNLLFE